MSKKEEIFLSQCFNTAKENILNQGFPIEGNEKKILELAEKIFRLAAERNFLNLPEQVESEKGR